MLVLSVLLIGYGVYQGHRAKQCGSRPSLASSLVLWMSAGIVAVMLLFPQVVANFLAGA